MKKISLIIIASILLLSLGMSTGASAMSSEDFVNKDIIVNEYSVEQGELFFDGEAVTDTIIADNGERLIITVQEIPTIQPFAIGRGNRTLYVNVSKYDGSYPCSYTINLSYEYDTNRDGAYFTSATHTLTYGGGLNTEWSGRGTSNVSFHVYEGSGQNTNTYGGGISFSISSSGRFSYSTYGTMRA